MPGTVKNEQGIVALLTTIFVGILLSVITVSLVNQMVSELRQAGDYEQSQRAYYAAKAGVEDASAKVVKAAANGQVVTQECGDSGSFKDLVSTTQPASSQGVNVGWTCQRILLVGTPSGKLTRPDVAQQIDTSGSVAYQSVKFEWDIFSGSRSLPGSTAPFPNGSWSSSYPAPLEVTVVKFPRGAFTSSSTAVSTSNALFYPTSRAASSIDLNGLSGSNPIAASCTNRNGAGYNCNATITNFDSSYNYIFRVRSRYVGTDYQMTFYNGSTRVDVPDGTATIDVTGKVGDAYRRLVYKLPYSRGASAGLDFVIYSDTDILKNCAINTDPSASSSCP